MVINHDWKEYHTPQAVAFKEQLVSQSKRISECTEKWVLPCLGIGLYWDGYLLHYIIFALGIEGHLRSEAELVRKARPEGERPKYWIEKEIKLKRSIYPILQYAFQSGYLLITVLAAHPA